MKFFCNFKKILATSLLLGTFAVLTACAGGTAPAGDPSALIGTDDIFDLPNDTVGEITVMMWSGSGQFLTDVGRRNFADDEITAQNDAALIATARAFNRIFPNIQVNIHNRIGGPEGDGISWDQYRQNFAMEFGHYPDLFAVHNLVDDVMRGIVADLSIFADDPMVQAFNPAVLELMTIEGRLFALPQYLLPWGVFVNKSLAEARNLDVPSPQWTLDEFVRFVSNSAPNEFYGLMSPPWDFVDSGTLDFHYQLMNRQEGEPFVRLNSDATRNLLAQMPAVLPHAVWAQNTAGLVDSAFMDDNWWWGHRFFQQGRLLVAPGDPWMMGDLAMPGTDGTATMAQWDIFPRPSTPYVGNHVGVVSDPMAIFNFAMNDGDPALSEEEYQQLLIAWTFLQFKTGDTRAWEERSTQLYAVDGGYRVAANDSFPFVTGQAFYDQMELWFRGGRERFADPHLMPGFHYVLELWEQGAFVPFSDKSVPWHFEFEGTSRMITFEWANKWSADVAGVGEADPGWLDMVFSRLPDWDTEINQRFADAYVALADAVARFYPPQTRPSA